MLQVREDSRTLKRQFEELAAGQRLCVLVMAGSLLSVEPGLALYYTPDGTFVYDPTRVPRMEVERAYLADEIGLLLGYGIARKPEIGGTGTVVVVRDSRGIEVRAVVTDQDNLISVRNAAQAIMRMGDTLTFETPEHVLARRLGA